MIEQLKVTKSFYGFIFWARIIIVPETDTNAHALWTQMYKKSCMHFTQCFLWNEWAVMFGHNIYKQLRSKGNL